jgi:TetR/AcrR family transcriptional regulator, transcriptional repressor for nem operon
MRYSEEHKEATRRRILTAVGRGFRKAGFGGIGVDGLSKFANLTSGAFYSNFRSKAEAFQAAVHFGIAEVRTAIESYRDEHGGAWIEPFAEFYFTQFVSCEAADGCALPGLSGDAARSDPKTRAVFEKEYVALVGSIAEGLSGRSEARMSKAIVVTALLAGGVTLARAMKGKAMRDRVAAAARDAVIDVARG